MYFLSYSHHVDRECGLRSTKTYLTLSPTVWWCWIAIGGGVRIITDGRVHGLSDIQVSFRLYDIIGGTLLNHFPVFHCEIFHRVALQRHCRHLLAH